MSMQHKKEKINTCFECQIITLLIRQPLWISKANDPFNWNLKLVKFSGRGRAFTGLRASKIFPKIEVGVWLIYACVKLQL